MRLLWAVLSCVLILAVPAAAQDVLPDLRQVAPADLVVTKRGERVRLGFSSTATNMGAGPLTLHGFRPNTDTPKMRVDQLIDQRDGSARLVRDVGSMLYALHPDHDHWHFMGFEEYELRSADGKRLVGRDRKTGFCLGDRIPAPGAERLPSFNPAPLQGDTCGLGRPDLTSLFAGISPGWADQYAANLEGQYIDITGVPAGRYVLVHWVNTLGRIVEADYANNASSTRFQLKRPAGKKPRVKVLRRCPGLITCGPSR